DVAAALLDGEDPESHDEDDAEEHGGRPVDPLAHQEAVDHDHDADGEDLVVQPIPAPEMPEAHKVLCQPVAIVRRGAPGPRTRHPATRLTATLWMECGSF